MMTDGESPSVIISYQDEDDDVDVDDDPDEDDVDEDDDEDEDDAPVTEILLLTSLWTLSHGTGRQDVSHLDFL